MLDGGGALSRRGLAIKAIADLGDEVEVVVVGPPHRGADGNYMVKMLARRSSDGEHAILYLPIGTLPLLSSGRVFSKGKRLDFARNGRIDDLVIPDLATFQELGSNEAPEGLVSALRLPTGMGGRRSQQLFQYNVNGRRVFIPAVELARALYLRYAALAQVVMRPQGLMELCVAPAPNSYQHLELEFTSELPVGLLKGHGGRLFAERFAWIAVDPEARRGWDSILRRTQSGEVLRFDPPSIRQAPCRVRSIEDGPDVLVLEILSLGGRRHPCESLEFSHPALVKKVRHVLESQGGDWESEKGSGADAGGEPGVRKPVTTKLILDHEGKGSKSDGTKEKTTLYADEFESTIVVRAKHREIEIAGGQDAAAPVDTGMDGASGNGKTYSGTGPGGLAMTPSGGDGKRPQAGSSPDGRPDPLKPLTGVDPPELRRRKVSVAEPNSGTVLKSLDFELLETMETNWIGELKALIGVLRRMAENLPGVRVASSLRA